MRRNALPVPLRNILFTGVLTFLSVFSEESVVGGEDVRHSIVYSHENEFAGWPANGGLWMWGDEILVGFDRWTFNPSPAGRHHNEERIGAYLARSTDGGRSWQGEEKASNRKPVSKYNFEAPHFGIRL